jgi:glutamine synthetase
VSNDSNDPEYSNNDSLRGVGDMEAARTWLRQRNIQDIECVVPDLAGLPAAR